MRLHQACHTLNPSKSFNSIPRPDHNELYLIFTIITNVKEINFKWMNHLRNRMKKYYYYYTLIT